MVAQSTVAFFYILTVKIQLYFWFSYSFCSFTDKMINQHHLSNIWDEEANHENVKNVPWLTGRYILTRLYSGLRLSRTSGSGLVFSLLLSWLIVVATLSASLRSSVRVLASEGGVCSEPVSLCELSPAPLSRSPSTSVYNTRMRIMGFTKEKSEQVTQSRAFLDNLLCQKHSIRHKTWN